MRAERRLVIDFMGGRTRDGGGANSQWVDEDTRVALGCRVARSIGAGDVKTALERLFARHGRPRVLRSDNGRKFIAASLGEWLNAQGVARAVIEKGSPQQQAFVERFNGTREQQGAQPATDASGETISATSTPWNWDDNTFRLEGDWGRMKVLATRAEVEF